MSTDIVSNLKIVYSVIKVYDCYLNLLNAYKKVKGRPHKNLTKRRIKKKKFKNIDNDNVGMLPLRDSSLTPYRPHQPLQREIKNISPELIQGIINISPRHFKILANLFNSKLLKYSPRPSFSPEHRLAITLLYMARGCERKILAKEYNLGASTVNNIVNETCEVICKALISYLPDLSEIDWKSVAEGFQNKWDIPNCVGVINGKLFKIRTHHSDSELIKGVAVIASCDSRYCFTTIDLANYGRKNEIYNFPPGSFCSQLTNNTLHLPDGVPLTDTKYSFPYYFIGDEKFPLNKHLMTPYTGPMSTMEREYFNDRLTWTFKCAENAFGILTSRWQILTGILRCGAANVKNTLMAAILLHNYLVINEDDCYCPDGYADHFQNGQLIEGIWRQNVTVLDPCRSFPTKAGAEDAVIQRDQLCEYINNTTGVPNDFIHILWSS